MYLGASAIGATFTLNAERPLAREGRFSVPVFFAGWLTSELPLHHLAWQLAATAVFIRGGALGAWPGWVGLVLTLVSWAGLLDLFAHARAARGIVDRALVETLGTLPAADEPGLAEMMRPFGWHRRDVERTGDVPYGPYGRRNLLDVYRPARRDRPTGAPVLIQVQGWVCVSINYRLSPRSTFPDHLVDVKRAIAWVKDHIAEYGGDPDFVVITGGSAGGHLASLATLTAGDPGLQPGFEGADTSVAACVPFYGVYDFTDRSDLGRAGLVRLLERRVIKKRLAEARDVFDRASPMSHVHAGAPPFLVVQGTHDTLVPVAEARVFVELLRKASRAPVAYVELPQAQHAFEVFSSVRTAYVLRGVERFLAFVYDEHLRRESARGVLPARDVRPSRADTADVVA